MRWTCCLCTVGQVVHTLPEGEPVRGVTSLADEVYVLRDKERDQVEVYDVINYRLQRRLTVPDICEFVDMTSCEHYRCVYIADCIVYLIHRVDVQGVVAQWAVDGRSWSISVNAAHNVLVTCSDDGYKIKEFTSHGEFLRVLSLPGDLNNPHHTIQTRNGEFIVCHGYGGNSHRVCKISADGHDIIKSHGAKRGSCIALYNVPGHLAVDNNEFVFVVDRENQRVTLLSPPLVYLRQVVSPDDLKWKPWRLSLDIHRRRLYVTENEGTDRKCTAGRVVVFSV